MTSHSKDDNPARDPSGSGRTAAAETEALTQDHADPSERLILDRPSLTDPGDLNSSSFLCEEDDPEPVVPDDAELTARHAEISAWDDVPADLKPVLARQMEAYAGFMEHTDHHVGRLVDSLTDHHVGRQPIQRQDQMGATRRRNRRQRPPHHPEERLRVATARQ